MNAGAGAIVAPHFAVLMYKSLVCLSLCTLGFEREAFWLQRLSHSSQLTSLNQKQATAFDKLVRKEPY